MDLTEVQRQLGLAFKNPELLLEALTHSSCLNNPSMGLEKHNEALAWLGDALLYWVVSEQEYREGLSPEDLHNLRENYINEGYLAKRVVYYGLDTAMRVTEGQAKEGGRKNQKNLHTVYEAVIGAIYRDKGYEHAKDFILKRARLSPEDLNAL